MKYPTLVRQRTSTTCGQCCVAMTMQCSFEAAVQMIGHKDISSDEDMQRVFATEEPFVPGDPPEGSVALQKHKQPDGDLEHWTVFYRDKVLDPACIQKGLRPVSKHLVILPPVYVPET